MENNKISKIYPLSPMQKGILFHSLIDEGPSYFEQVEFTIEGDLDVVSFQKSVQHLVDRHDIFRTVFIHKKIQTPRQVVLRKLNIEVHYEELVEKAETTKRDYIDYFKVKDKERGFDLSKDLLMRFSVFKTNSNAYQIVWSYHHILMDGWCTDIVLKEILHIYKSIKHNMEISLPKVNPYYKYIEWLNEKDEEVAKEYWGKRLQDYEEQALIPYSRTLAGKYTYQEKEMLFTLSQEVTKAFYDLAKKLKVTTSNLFQSIWGILLQKYNNSSDVVFGSVVSGRSSEIDGIENMVGLFINTIPVRVTLPETQKFIDLVQQVQHYAVQSEGYEYIPLAEIQNSSSLKSDLIQHIVTFQNFGLSDVREVSEENNEGFKITGVETFEKTNYNLNIMVIPQKQLGLKFMYNANLYDSVIFHNIVNYLTSLIKQVVDNPNCSIKGLSLITDQELRKIQTYNNTSTDYEKHKTLVELFEEQVKKNPKQTAIEWMDQKVNYEELNEKANRIARYLRSVGVERNSIVGLMCQRSIETFVSILGILKSGGAYMPIDPEYPVERIEYMLQDSGANWLLTNTALAQPFNFNGTIYSIQDVLSTQDDVQVSVEIVNESDDLASIIYTSGSTGKPKGNLTTHYNISRVVRKTNYIEIKESDKLLQLSNFAFDGSTFDIYGALLNGATLVGITQEEAGSIKKLTQRIVESEVTVLFITTALFNVLVDMNVNELKNVRKILFGGEKVSVPHVKKALDMVGPGKLIHVYGPTESTVFATSYEVNEIPEQVKTIPIGKPIGNTKAYVMDKGMNIQPFGIIGELCLSGDGIAKGYLNNEVLTKEKFIEHQLLPGERLYLTGDYVRMLEDGNIEYIGRVDQQLKIRGFRIEVSEVESSLIQHPKINDVVVMPIKNNEQLDLCAYYVSNSEIIEDIELIDFLKKELPDFMVPTFFVELDSFPLTANGKVNKKGLPQPVFSELIDNYYVAPENETQMKLAGIWEDILNVERVGIREDFFKLGGHSLTAMALSSRIAKEFNLDVPLNKVFIHSTISKMAMYIERSYKTSNQIITKVNKQEVYEVSSAQKRIYTSHQQEQDNINYNIPFVFKLIGELRYDHFLNALKQLVDRHEVLRTSFELYQNQIVQRIHESIELSIPVKKKTVEQVEKEINSFIRPFNLNLAPLFRMEVLEISEEEYIVMMDFHHIIMDGKSLDIFLRELFAFYEGKELKDLEIQYKDYAKWQLNQLNHENMKDSETYWMNRFADPVPNLELPTDYPRTSFRQRIGNHHKFIIDSKLTNKLIKLAEQQDSTLYMVLLSAYHILLTKYTQQEEIVIGSPISNRVDAAIEPLIGIFVNTLLLKNVSRSELTFIDFLQTVKSNVLDAYKHKEYQMDKLVEKLSGSWDSPVNLFNTMFALQNMELSEPNVQDFLFEPYEYNVQIAKYDLLLTAMQVEDKLNFEFEYNTQLFKQETIERMANHFINLLEQVIEDDSCSLQDLQLVTPKERVQLLEDFNQTTVEHPVNLTVQEFIEKKAVIQPDQIAVFDEEHKLTYQELNKRANQLAYALRREGAQPNETIGIIMKPSTDMIVSVLGVLKSGAAYVPIDPNYPTERINFILKDSRCSIVVTQGNLMDTIDFPGLIINMDWLLWENEDSTNISLVNCSSDLAYVVYTSGSTGTPKGVMVEHASLVNLSHWHIRAFDIKAVDRSTKYAGFGFDASVWEIFPSLIAGSTIFIVPEAIRKDINQLNAYFEHHQITISFLPTQLCEQFMQLENHSLRILLTGGDRLTVSPKGASQYELVNNYGPTENTVVATSYRVPRGSTDLPIGKPIDNVQAYVFNNHGQLQPIGVPGELYLGGKGVARGYWMSPELTEKQFLSNPYNPEERLYKTGDIVKWGPEGNLVFIGRTDNQVSIRGYRIELNEITDQLLTYPDVQEAVVIAQKDQQQQYYLVGYVVSTTGTVLSVDVLRKWLKNSLPEYMIPAVFVELEAMPITANGKIDEKSLPTADYATLSEVDYKAPTNLTEMKLVEIWEDVLGVSPIGIHDEFFNRGGHSLKVTQIIARINDELDVKLSFSEFFKLITVREQAEHIRESINIEQKYPKIKPLEKHEYYPASSYQVYSYEDSSGNLAYNMPQMLLIEGELDLARLEAGFKYLINRHETLRTSFHCVNGQIMMKVQEQVPFNLIVEEANEDDVPMLINDHIRFFELQQAPILHVKVLKINSLRHILMFDTHHILSDGTSFSLLFSELIDFYVNKKDLPPLGIQFKDYVVWKQQLIEDGYMDQHREYWLNTLSGELPVLNIKTDFPRPEKHQMIGDSFKFNLSEELTTKIREFNRKTGTTLYMTLLAAYNAFLMKYSGQEDIIVGTWVAGRTTKEVENVQGLFINPLPLRNYPYSDKTFVNFLTEVRENLLESYEYQDYPFEMICEDLHLKKDPSRQEIYDTVLSLINLDMPTFEVDGLNISGLPFDFKVSEYDFYLSVFEGEQKLYMDFAYSTLLFKQETIEKFATDYIQTLEQLIENPDITLNDIQLDNLEKMYHKIGGEQG